MNATITQDTVQLPRETYQAMYDTKKCSQRDADRGNIEDRLRNVERTLQYLLPTLL